MYKLVTTSLISAIVASLLWGCAGSASKTPLTTLAERINEHCPIMLQSVGEMTEVSVKGDTLIYKCKVLNRGLDVNVIGDNADEFKAAFTPMIPVLLGQEGHNSDDGTELSPAAILIDNNAYLTFNFYSTGARAASVDITFTPQELKNAMK